MFDELLEFLDSNWELNSLKYIEYTKKAFNEMNLGFDYVYDKLLKELNEKKDNKLSDRLMYTKKVFENNSKKELENQFLNICDIYETYVSITEANELLNFFDEVKNIPFFHLADKSVGNRHMYTFFNKHLRNYINESTTKPNYFTMRCGDSNKHYDDFINNRIISITWDNIDNVINMSKNELRDYANHKYGSVRTPAQFDTFVNKMKIGDIVLLLRRGTNIANIAVITSDALFAESNPRLYSNYRTIEFLAEAKLGFCGGIQATIMPVNKKENIEAIEIVLDEAMKAKYSKVMSALDTERRFEFSKESLVVNCDKKISNENFTETGYKQLIIDGAPGTGKSYGVNQEVKKNDINHERVTFYSDYEYHNFIGSILPKLNGETVIYEFVKGPFTKILNDALSNPEDKHYLIVEELTRGNAAAIFGDIFQLLDRDEEGWSEYPITHNNILESLDPEVRTFLENEYGSKIVLPPNLSIICTINSSDQNVYPLDTAFKRRFDYKIESTNVHSEFVDYDIKFGTDIIVSWVDFYQKLNKYILVDLGLKEDKQVGPYFIKNHKGNNKKLESIQTKLAMYMWNDLHKVHTISNKTIFKDVHTLYEVDNLFRTGSREQILNVLSEEFKQHFNLKGSSDLTE